MSFEVCESAVAATNFYFNTKYHLRFGAIAASRTRWPFSWARDTPYGVSP